ncbi:hypothetical protein [Streptomyces sp. NPDC047061]|uniref:hypothetical protein n=1 Tax=Streptomyces sp. NPDC047061 TaxID=3154605 RepID=UPI0033C76E6C
MTDDLVANAFEGLGVPYSSAAAMAQLLRDDVTDTLCGLYPGVAHLDGSRWLLAAASALPTTVPALAQTMIPGLDEHRAQSAALPAVLLLGLADGLGRRSGLGDAGRAAPGSKLRKAARTRAPELVAGELAGQEGLCRQLAGLLHSSAVTLGASGDKAQGGWALLAAMEACRVHPLPEPGRTSTTPGGQLAGRAFRLGRALLYGIALELIGTDPDAWATPRRSFRSAFVVVGSLVVWFLLGFVLPRWFFYLLLPITVGGYLLFSSAAGRARSRGD